jgi:hypothetical protein
MSIQQAKTMLLNSTAGPLPTGATGTRFPLTVGSARCIQEADFNQIFDANPAILGCINGFFRCRQRKCERAGLGRNRDADRRDAPPAALLTLRCAWTSGALAQKMLAECDVRSRVVDGTLDPRRLQSAELLLRDAA